MAKFIRLDQKGEWRGSEHRSSMLGLAEEWLNCGFENGVSCYELTDQAEALDELRKYWTVIATTTDFTSFQVTIFEGEKTGEGPDYEDIALPEKTLYEGEAQPLMQKIIDLEDMFYDDEEKYKAALNNINLQGVMN